MDKEDLINANIALVLKKIASDLRKHQASFENLDEWDDGYDYALAYVIEMVEDRARKARDEVKGDQ